MMRRAPPPEREKAKSPNCHPMRLDLSIDDRSSPVFEQGTEGGDAV